MTGTSTAAAGTAPPIWHIDDSDPEIEGLDESGQPDPRYASALGMLSAPLPRRFLAALFDLLIFFAVQIPFWVGSSSLLIMYLTGQISSYGLMMHSGFVLACVLAGVSLVLTIALLVVQLVLQGQKGVSIGKAIAGIRMVNVRTLERPRVGPVFARFMIVMAFGMIPTVGQILLFMSTLSDASHRSRGWHDKATGIWLVDSRNALNPFDTKRMRIARKLVKTAPLAKPAPLPSLATPPDVYTKPQYQPEQRISVAVLGVAKAYDQGSRPNVGFLELPGNVEQTPVAPGVPVLGGYRKPKDTPAPVSANTTASVPASALPGVAQQPTRGMGAPSLQPMAPSAAVPTPGVTPGGAPSAPSWNASAAAPQFATGHNQPAVVAPHATPPQFGGSPAGSAPAFVPAHEHSASVPPPFTSSPALPSNVPSTPALPGVVSPNYAPAQASYTPAQTGQNLPSYPQQYTPKPPELQLEQTQRPTAEERAELSSSRSNPTPAAARTAAPTPAPVRAPEPQAAPEPTPRLAVLSTDGTTFTIDGLTLFGRKPDANKHQAATAVALPDDTRTLSKTHLSVSPANGVLEVVDLGSTNGSSVIHNGARRTLVAGAPTTVDKDDVLLLGDLELLVIHV